MSDVTRMPDAPDPDLAALLRRVARETTVPPVDAAREAALLAAFDGARRPSIARAGYWWMGTLATAAALLIATGLVRPGAGRRDPPPGPDQQRPHTLAGVRGVPAQVDLVGEFVTWPGSASLPPLESGQLVRVSLPVSVLPGLGLTPPASNVSAVRADVLVGQDGLARAVRLIN